MKAPAADQISKEQQSLIAKLLENLPEDFAARRSALRQIRIAMLEEMATALQGPMNEFLDAAPASTLQERRELVSALNSDLREISLCIKCPRTARPAILISDVRDGEHQDALRFRIQTTDDQGRTRRTVTSENVPTPLELMVSPQRREALSRDSGSRSRG